jgi:hypothetical protein
VVSGVDRVAIIGAVIVPPLGDGLIATSGGAVEKAAIWTSIEGIWTSRRNLHLGVDDDLWYLSMMRSARDNAELADTARQGVSILGPDAPTAARLENIARYLDYVSESITRAAEQAREILYTKEKRPQAAAPPRQPQIATSPSPRPGRYMKGTEPA